jgi:hypothetical protein
MATRKTMVTHVLTVGSTKIGLDQPKDEYTNIGDIVGIKEAAENSDQDAHETVSQLQVNGRVIRLSCRMSDKKTNTILCATDKVSSARSQLRGKTINGKTIKSVTISRKRNRR